MHLIWILKIILDLAEKLSWWQLIFWHRRFRLVSVKKATEQILYYTRINMFKKQYKQVFLLKKKINNFSSVLNRGVTQVT